MKKIFSIALIFMAILILTNCQSTPQKEVTLHELINEGRTQEAKDSFAAKYNVNDVDENGNTALHIAAAKNDADMVEFLIFKKADIDLKNLANQTPLHVAIDKGALDAARSLVSLGANVFSRTVIKKQRLKEKPVEIAIPAINDEAEQGSNDESAGQDNNDDAQDSNADGQDSNATSQATNGTTEDEYEEYEEEISAIDLAFSKSDEYYDIFITEKTMESRNEDDGSNIIHYFVRNKNEMAINYCVQKKLPLSIPDNNGKTPLNVAFEMLNETPNDKALVNIIALLAGNGSELVESEDYEYFLTALSNHNMDYRFDDNQTPLHIAAILGHGAIASYLVENKAATDVQDTSGSTPLHEAVRYGRTEIVSLLLGAGANPNARDNIGKTPLLLSIPHEAQNDIYSSLLSGRSDTKIKDTYGDTVLHIATMTNAPVDLLAKFIASGADINARNKEGVTPLAIAVEKKIASHVKYYADKGANIHTKDTKCRTPLIMALNADGNLIEQIVNRNNVVLQDSSGNMALHIAILNDVELPKIQYILSLTDDVNIRNGDGNTPLYLAVLKNRQKLGDLLLQKNADVFATNNKNRSPLSLALNAGGAVMDWILTPKTVTARDGSGNTALHYASEWGLEDAITAIIQKGGDAEARNANGETPIFSASKSDNPAIAGKLVSNGAKVNARDNLGSTPLHVAVRWENFNTAAKLISLGAVIDAQNVSGKSPLSEAALSGKYDIAKMLLDKGANPNISDSSGKTILMDSIRGKNEELVRLLLSYHANPNIQDVAGKNSYHEAALSCDKQIITLVREAGGNPLSRDKNGKTPFSLTLNESDDIITAVLGDDKTVVDSDGNSPVHIVVKNNCPVSILNLLVKLEYPFDTRNSDGYTPLGIAIEANNVEYSQILLANGANPFIMIDKKGKNPATIALAKNNETIISDIAKYSGNLSDIQGNTILHYAAKSASDATVTKLLSYGLDSSAKNVSGETPYITATRWNRSNIAQLFNSGTSTAPVSSPSQSMQDDYYAEDDYVDDAK